MATSAVGAVINVETRSAATLKSFSKPVRCTASIQFFFEFTTLKTHFFFLKLFSYIYFHSTQHYLLTLTNVC